jgi:heme/copper-type cytochrome/quinol oxidase subunit 2
VAMIMIMDIAMENTIMIMITIMDLVIMFILILLTKRKRRNNLSRKDSLLQMKMKYIITVIAMNTIISMNTITIMNMNMTMKTDMITDMIMLRRPNRRKRRIILMLKVPICMY